MRRLFIMCFLCTLVLSLSSFTEKASDSFAPYGVTLEQVSGTANAGDLVRLDDSGSNLIVSFGTSFRIDWSGYGGLFYPEGTTVVPIYADRFMIGVPAYGSSTVNTYVFVIHRNYE